MKNSEHRWHKKSDFLKSLFKVYEDVDIESLLTLRDALNIVISSKHNHKSIDYDKYKGYVIYD